MSIDRSRLYRFDEFINESYSDKDIITLSKDEKLFLWSKLNPIKKEKAEETESDLFKMLTRSKTIFTNDFIKILNSLDYNIKKKLKSGEESDNNNNINNNINNRYKFQEVLDSLKKKLPNEWLNTGNISNLIAKKPTESSSLVDIKTYLDSKKIEYKSSDTKTILLSLLK